MNFIAQPGCFFELQFLGRLFHFGMIEPVKAFVRQQQPRLRGERACKLELLQRRCAEPVRGDARIGRQSDHRERLFGVIPRGLLR